MEPEIQARVQTINDDTVLEVTEMVPVKTRYSETRLLERKTYLESMIAKLQADLLEVNARLNDIDNAKAAK